MMYRFFGLLLVAVVGLIAGWSSPTLAQGGEGQAASQPGEFVQVGSTDATPSATPPGASTAAAPTHLGATTAQDATIAAWKPFYILVPLITLVIALGGGFFLHAYRWEAAWKIHPPGAPSWTTLLGPSVLLILALFLCDIGIVGYFYHLGAESKEAVSRYLGTFMTYWAVFLVLALAGLHLSSFFSSSRR